MKESVFSSPSGVELFYRVAGNPQGKKVLFHHPLSSSLGFWTEVQDLLSSKYHTLAYDARGMGRSSVTKAPYTFEMLQNDCIAVTEHVFGKNEKFYFVGCSMGGLLGLKLAIHHPNLLHGLVVNCSFCRVGEGAEELWKERVTTVRSNGMPFVADTTMERWFSKEALKENNAKVQRTR